ncbi:molybdopterin guanine dinucleotide synthesis B family protein [Vibrio penaeicida]|uniref:molybdopterin guanine dinucleotide synthesis B family protein n=1 Tax=Vibrio penaeicida TaxID=104609 RepID=UPI000CEA6EA0|nr:molybdopterin guanine dinucleotide synthesis B family protein [Vibrio penaeicida]
MISLNQSQRIVSAKRSFVTRRVPIELMQTLVTGIQTPKAGDLVLAKVTLLGHHKRSERVDGRRATLFQGDEVILAYGNRYAPDQFEAIVPDSMEPCHMVAAGGIAGKALSWHHKIDFPTEITPIGLIGNAEGKIINLSDFSVHPPATTQLIPNVVVVGTSMNAGKTTSAAHIIHGLTKAGYQVGAMKVTGTGAGGDLWLMQDAGAHSAIDFTDAGYPTSFNVKLNELNDIVEKLSAELIHRGCNAIVVEIADGVYQRETRALLQNPSFKANYRNIVFTARESLGATSGAQWLTDQGYYVPAISGMICASPLAHREAAKQIDVPVYGLEQLVEPRIAKSLLNFPVALEEKISA